MESQDRQDRTFVDSRPSARQNPGFIDFLNRDQKNEVKGTELEKMDYVAMFIALLETVFLPVLILISIFILVGLFVSGFFTNLLTDTLNFIDNLFYPVPSLIVNIVFGLLTIGILYVFVRILFKNADKEVN